MQMTSNDVWKRSLSTAIEDLEVARAILQGNGKAKFSKADLQEARRHGMETLKEKWVCIIYDVTDDTTLLCMSAQPKATQRALDLCTDHMLCGTNYVRLDEECKEVLDHAIEVLKPYQLRKQLPCPIRQWWYDDSELFREALYRIEKLWPDKERYTS